MHELYTPDDLQEYLNRNQIRATLLPDMGHTPTVRAAAKVLGVQADQIVKTLLFVVQSTGEEQLSPEHTNGIIVISHGEHRVNTERLAQHIEAPVDAVRLARPHIVSTRLGYPAGGVPPFGHRISHPVLLEQSLLTIQKQLGDHVYAGGGDDRTMLETSVSELLRVLEPEIVDLDSP